MRQGLWTIVACSLVWAAPARAQTAPVPTKSAPIVVAGVPVTTAQARARVGRNAADFQVRDMLAELAQARVVATEAALRGVTADPDEVQSAVAREQLHAGGAAEWRAALKQKGIDEGEALSVIAEGVLQARLVDAITTATRGDAQAWGRALDSLNERGRAMTTCTPATARQLPDTCSNARRRKDACLWFGVGTLCRWTYQGPAGDRWGGYAHLELLFEPDQAGLGCDVGDEHTLPRLRAYLERAAPAVLRRVHFEATCDPHIVGSRRRADIIVVFHAIARIVAQVRRG
jgi:hypothetical protein